MRLVSKLGTTQTFCNNISGAWRYTTQGNAMSAFWDVLILTFTVFFFFAYLMVLFQVISDLFRDGELSGLSKALWIVFLIFLPLLTSLVYLLVRGKGMGQRQRVAVEKAMSETDAYIRQVAGKSPADQIADAKKLLDSGTISADEFAKLKAKALG